MLLYGDCQHVPDTLQALFMQNLKPELQKRMQIDLIKVKLTLNRKPRHREADLLSSTITSKGRATTPVQYSAVSKNSPLISWI